MSSVYAQIKWQDRFLSAPTDATCVVSVDGTGFPICEPTPFDRKWYSQKFRGAGLRCEVGVGIYTGRIVWFNGPFPCGAFPDRNIARLCLHQALAPSETYLADGRYRDQNSPAVTPTGQWRYSDCQRAVVRACHETVNRRLKTFALLGSRY